MPASLHLFISACVTTGVMPSFGKRSIIVPILKSGGGDKSLGNIRPISLQSALAKLVCKLFAMRLSVILARHPSILHRAQRGFIPGGESARCVELVWDLWVRQRAAKQPLFNIFYDIRAAYDSVRHDDLLRALARLRLPQLFVQFVRDSLTDLSSVVRTPYGNSASFRVTRSVRQGDPPAPLLFIFFLDSLHCLYDCIPGGLDLRADDPHPDDPYEEDQRDNAALEALMLRLLMVWLRPPMV